MYSSRPFDQSTITQWCEKSRCWWKVSQPFPISCIIRSDQRRQMSEAPPRKATWKAPPPRKLDYKFLTLHSKKKRKKKKEKKKTLGSKNQDTWLFSNQSAIDTYLSRKRPSLPCVGPLASYLTQLHHAKFSIPIYIVFIPQYSSAITLYFEGRDFKF